jgi:proteasome lid subunit RPN8/RPN11
MVYISSKVIGIINAETSCYNKKETGGILLGYESGTDYYIIDSTFSGPKAVHGSAHFEMDDEYANYEINMLSALYDRPTCVIGYWHSHVHRSPFSLQDEVTNVSFAHLNKNGAICVLMQCEDNTLEVYHTGRSGQSRKCDYRILDETIKPEKG